jgi:uncharacterized membrane protein required for colicin V production
MKKLLQSKTTWVGLIILILAAFETFKNGVSADVITLVSIGAGFMIAKDGETFKRA